MRRGPGALRIASDRGIAVDRAWIGAAPDIRARAGDPGAAPPALSEAS